MLHIEKLINDSHKEPRWGDITPKGVDGGLIEARQMLKEYPSLKAGETYRIVDVLETIDTKQPPPVFEVINSEPIEQPPKQYTQKELAFLAKRADSRNDEAREELINLCKYYGLDIETEELWKDTVHGIWSAQQSKFSNQDVIDETEDYDA